MQSGPFANTEATVALLFFFFALASGIVARQLLLIYDLFPYTALQFLLGFIFGIWNFSGDNDQLGVGAKFTCSMDDSYFTVVL